MTDYTKSQLAQILSAIDGQRRNPNNKAGARRMLQARATALGLKLDDILTAADGLLDGRMSAEEFRAALTEPQPEPEATSETPQRQRREGTKQNLLITMMRHPGGATIDQLAQVTGWQKHTVRGAIAGSLKKKLGLTITAEKVRQVGPNNVGAAGSTTIYRIVD